MDLAEKERGPPNAGIAAMSRSSEGGSSATWELLVVPLSLAMGVRASTSPHHQSSDPSPLSFGFAGCGHSTSLEAVASIALLVLPVGLAELLVCTLRQPRITRASTPYEERKKTYK